jgi:hypothetical protein
MLRDTPAAARAKYDTPSSSSCCCCCCCIAALVALGNILKVTNFKRGNVWLKRRKLTKEEVEQLPLPRGCKVVLLMEPSMPSKVGLRAATCWEVGTQEC